MLLHVRNMVCDRCIFVVRQQLERLGYDVQDISLGQVHVSPEPDESALQLIDSSFREIGFELISDEKERLVAAVKSNVIEYVHYSDLNNLQQGLIATIASELNKDATYLSRLFSDLENSTIERYIIQQKIEKVKELLEYGELNLNEISYQLGYSSSSHLSSQFKAIVGMSPRQYKLLAHPKRRPLDQL